MLLLGTSTRELAYQIAEQFRVLGKPLGLRDCIIVGGMGKTLAAGNATLVFTGNQ